jgi:hypothetical protein
MRMNVAVLLLVVCLTSFVLAQTKQDTALSFDAHWWLNDISTNEQDGFVYGYRDCFQPQRAAVGSNVDYRDFVTNALSSTAPDAPRTAPAAIQLAWKTMKSRTPLPGGEVHKGPHGFLDGSWWGEFDGARPPDVANSDRGYVEGYLACAAPPVTEARVQRLQAAIDAHYASGERENDAIAVVLQRLLKNETSKSH